VFFSLTLVTKYWLSKNVSKHKPDSFIHSFLKGKQKRKERRLTSINYEGHCICLVCTFIFSLYIANKTSHLLLYPLCCTS
jgi:hypothetical protein